MTGDWRPTAIPGGSTVLSSVALSLVTTLSMGVATPQIPVAGVVAPVIGFPEAVPAAMLMSQVVTRTNQLRDVAGCGQLSVNQNLISSSVNQSYYMAATGTFSHIGGGGSTFVARARAAGYAQPAGENIAWGYGTADEVMAAWMASPRHRANILNCAAKSIGTGVVYSPNGLPYYTEVFGWV
jgi:uncharacterized protein YkwD